MANSTNNEQKPRGGKIKRLSLFILFIIMAYLSVHVYFFWQPVGKSDQFSQAVMKAEVGGYKVFPAIQDFNLAKIDARKEILAGDRLPVSPLPERLKNAIAANQPVTFTEREVNVWLRHRLQVKQAGMLEEYAKITGGWVNFTKDEVEIIIERKLDKPRDMTHVVSLIMSFKTVDNGFVIRRDSSTVGQVRVPGGFARLIMPSYQKMVEELEDELLLYKNEKGKYQIHNVVVKDGMITLDPRRPQERNK